MTEAKLGDIVQDTITGYKGVVVGITMWMTGCDRATIQAPVKKGSNEIPESYSTDIPLLKVITPAKKKEVKKRAKVGGFNLKTPKY